MTNKLVAAAVAVFAAGGFAASAMATEGPRPSSENFIAPAAADVPVDAYGPSRLGPKVSSENYIAPAGHGIVAAAEPATGAQHWVYQQGYDPHGKWRGHWMLVR
jgi:hypothetical protein